jgi:DNA repair exonuclease SbcCD ATPase subunit
MNLDEQIAEQREKVKALEAELRRAETEAEEEAKRLKEKLHQEFKEVVKYARRRKHTWPDKDALMRRAYDAGDEGFVFYLVELFSMDEVHPFGGTAPATSRMQDAEEELREANRELRKQRDRRRQLRKR